MPFFLHKSPSLLQRFFSDYEWYVRTDDKTLYLTFDDGPIPEITEWVLEQLAQYQAKATFFCIGENIEKHRNIFQKLIFEGHSVGNHTHNHLNGWKTHTAEYLRNVAQCQNILGTTTNLFRPPYGRIRDNQGQQLLPNHRIVMWDVLTGDFEKYLSPQRCLSKTLKYTRNGSIIVMHDSRKAWQNMSYVLPRTLQHFSEQGYTFEALPQELPLNLKLSDVSLSLV